MEKVSKPADISRALRKALGGITQGELAARLLVSRNYISQIEADLKTPSDRLLSQMQALLTESAGAGEKVSKSKGDQNVEEEQTPYGSVHQIRHEIRRHTEDLLAAAGDDRDRLGWIIEQQRLHLPEPPHWRTKRGAQDEAAAGKITPDMHAAALHQALEEKSAASSGPTSQSSKGKAHGGAGR